MIAIAREDFSDDISVDTYSIIAFNGTGGADHLLHTAYLLMLAS